MPIGGNTILVFTGILTHWGNPDSISGSHPADGHGFKELGHGISLTKDMLLDLPKKRNTGDILLLKKLAALPKNFWFILLGALLAQLILISVSTLSGDPMGDVRYTYEAWTKNMAQGNYLLGL